MASFGQESVEEYLFEKNISGVSQWFCAGPLLFIIIINNINIRDLITDYNILFIILWENIIELNNRFYKFVIKHKNIFSSKFSEISWCGFSYSLTWIIILMQFGWQKNLEYILTMNIVLLNL